MVVLILVASSLYIAYVFSYLYLWTVSPEVWSPVGSPALPTLAWPIAVVILLVVGALAMRAGDRALPAPGSRALRVPLLLAVGLLCLVGTVAVDLAAHWASGLRPSENAYGAMVDMSIALNGQLLFAVFILIGFAIAR
jgi:cytochrome c oxidase subunit I+III